jgi:hypothetical protein
MIQNILGYDDEPYVPQNIITMFCETGVTCTKKVLRSLAYIYGDTSDRQQTWYKIRCDLPGEPNGTPRLG